MLRSPTSTFLLLKPRAHSRPRTSTSGKAKPSPIPASRGRRRDQGGANRSGRGRLDSSGDVCSLGADADGHPAPLPPSERFGGFLRKSRSALPEFWPAGRTRLCVRDPCGERRVPAARLRACGAGTASVATRGGRAAGREPRGSPAPPPPGLPEPRHPVRLSCQSLESKREPKEFPRRCQKQVREKKK